MVADSKTLVEAAEALQKQIYLYARQNSPHLQPQPFNVPAEAFHAEGEGILGTDFPGRYYFYRETVDERGYPPNIRIDPEFQNSQGTSSQWYNHHHPPHRQSPNKRPSTIHNIWSLPRNLAFLVRSRPQPSSLLSTSRPLLYPPAPPRNSICERFFPSTIASEGPPKLDSSFFYPFNLTLSVGLPKRPKRFLHEEFNLDENPFAARFLLHEGFQETSIDPGYWNTPRNAGWAKVTGPIVEVGEGETVAFVVSKKWERFWVGRFSFGGVRLKPIG
jgi:hypothetical protein